MTLAGHSAATVLGGMLPDSAAYNVRTQVASAQGEVRFGVELEF